MSKRPKVEKSTTAERVEALRQTTAEIRVAICLPSMGMTMTGFTFDLADMMSVTAVTLVATKQIAMSLHVVDGSALPSTRQSLVLMALRAGATHVLFLDTDMRFPRDTLVRLLEHGKPIVGVNYPSRDVHAVPLAIKTLETKDAPGERCYTRRDSTGLEEVLGIGLGCALIQTDVFTQIAVPWFEYRFDHGIADWVGEDIDFCLKARDRGIPVFVDHDLSQRVKHVGFFEYENAMAGMAAGEAPPPQLVTPG